MKENLTDKVIVLSRAELEAARLRSKTAKCDGEVHQFKWFITHGYNARIGIRDSTRVVFLFWHLHKKQNKNIFIKFENDFFINENIAMDH